MANELAEYEAEMDKDLVNLNRENAEAVLNDMRPPSEVAEYE